MTETSAEPAALTERRGPVTILTINRPSAFNAIDAEVTELLGDALEAADRDPEVRAVVITGAGPRAFCAGMDLKAFARGEPAVPVGREHWGFAGVAEHFVSTPVIAAVNGVALGGGFEIVLACDLVVAAENATFGLPEVTRGLIAAAGGAFRLTSRVPQRVALRALLTGEPIGAAEAERWGLVNEVVPAGEALDAALALAERIAANAPLAVQASKRIAYGSNGSPGSPAPEADHWELTNQEWDAVTASEDAAEGPRAFAEKRPPVWRAR